LTRGDPAIQALLAYAAELEAKAKLMDETKPTDDV